MQRTVTLIRANLPPFLDPARLLELLPKYPQSLWAAWLPELSWPAVWTALLTYRADWVAVHVERLGQLEVFLLAGSQRAPYRLARKVDNAEAVRLAIVWLLHRRQDELQFSPGWRLPLFTPSQAVPSTVACSGQQAGQAEALNAAGAEAPAVPRPALAAS